MTTNKKLRFSFADENSCPTDGGYCESWCFDIESGNENLSEDQLEEMVLNLIKDSHDYNGEDLEATYGIHDVSFDGNTDILGFSSYEVAEDKFPELMEKWRDIFAKRGYKTSAVYKTK